MAKISEPLFAFYVFHWLTWHYTRYPLLRNFSHRVLQIKGGALEESGVEPPPPMASPLTTTVKRMKIDPIVSDSVETHCIYFSTLCSLRRFAVDFFARGLHARTAVARLP